MVRAQKKLRTLGEQALALRFLSATSDARPILEDVVLRETSQTTLEAPKGWADNSPSLRAIHVRKSFTFV